MHHTESKKETPNIRVESEICYVDKGRRGYRPAIRRFNFRLQPRYQTCSYVVFLMNLSYYQGPVNELAKLGTHLNFARFLIKGYVLQPLIH